MKKMNLYLIASVAMFSFLISACNNNPVNPLPPGSQNIIDSLGIDTNNTNCTFNYTVAYDSNTNTYTFNGQGQGVAPIQYVWVINQDTLYGQSVSYTGNVSDFCGAMLDADGCFTSVCDSVSTGGGGGTGNCTTSFTTSIDSNNNVVIFMGSGTGVAPYSYNWNVNGTTYSGSTITVPFSGGNILSACLTQTDANGCTATYCDSIGANPGGSSCGVQTWAYVDSTGNNIVTANANATGVAPFSYAWTVNGMNYTGQTISWQGTSGQTYQACVTVVDANACTSTDCSVVVIP